MATEVITDSDDNLVKIISLLRDSNAAEELTLDEVSSHRYTLASPDAQSFIREVPKLLTHIGDFLKSIVAITKDVLENAATLVRNDKEEKIEETKPKNKPKDNASSGVSFTNTSRLFTSQGFLGRLLSIGSLLIGTIVGAIMPLVKIIKESKIGKIFANIFDSIKIKFGSILASIKESKIGKIFDKLFGSTTSKIIDTITDFVKPIMSFFKIGMKIGSVLRKILSKVALPLTIIIGLYDTIVGAIEGYKEDGIIGALKGGISGLLNSVVGSLLDLLKDGISWLLGALGWEEAEKTLDSFSFTELITQGVNGIIDGFISIFESLGEALVKGYETVKTAIGTGFNVAEAFIKTILQNILPKVDTNAAWYDPINLAASAIPKSVYDFAGINKDTGEVTPIKPSQISVAPPSTSAAISTNPAASIGTTIINNVTRGGDISNVSNSNVNNTNSAASPILTGSAMGILYAN